MFSSSIKQINRLTSKGMLLRKTDVLKTCWERKFLGKKILRNALALKGKKAQDCVSDFF